MSFSIATLLLSRYKGVKMSTFHRSVALIGSTTRSDVVRDCGPKGVVVSRVCGVVSSMGLMGSMGSMGSMGLMQFANSLAVDGLCINVRDVCITRECLWFSRR